MFLSLVLQYLEACARIWITNALSCYDNFALHVWMIAFLAFVSPNHVIQGFDNLAQVIRNAFGEDDNDILMVF